MKVLIWWSVIALLVLTVSAKHKDPTILRHKCLVTLNETNRDPSKIIDKPQILYYQLNGSDSTVRYTWSLVGAPTLLMTITPPTQVDCYESIKNAIEWETFIENQTYGSADIPGYDGSFSFAIVFNNLIEFRDENFKAAKDFNPSDLSNNKTYRNFSLSDLDWTFDNANQKLTGKDSNSTFHWDIQINVPTDSGRLGYFPKTQYNENSTSFDFIFENFHYEISYHSPVSYGRLVLEMILVHGDNLTSGSIEQTFSRDDEYTPSIFRTYNYLFGETDDKGGYLQWKPISYLSDKRKSTSAEQATLVPGVPVVNITFPPSLASALFNESTVSNVTNVYLVMGTEKDENNPNPEYVTWTALLGFGTPPTDKISFIVIITIIVGLGVPGVLVLVGGVYVVIKKKPWKKIKKKSYEKLINED